METIAQARSHGISVKMVTGDNLAIATEISGQLGLGKNIFPADKFFESGKDGDDIISLGPVYLFHRLKPVISLNFLFAVSV